MIDKNKPVFDLMRAIAFCHVRAVCALGPLASGPNGHKQSADDDRVLIRTAKNKQTTAEHTKLHGHKEPH